MPRWLLVAILHFLVSSVLVVWLVHRGIGEGADAATARTTALGLPIFEMVLATVTLVLELPLALPLLLLSGATGPPLFLIQCVNSALWGLAVARLSPISAGEQSGIG